MDLNMMKTIGSIVVSSGVGSVVSQACNHVKPNDLNRIGKLVNAIGSFALSMYVSNKVTDYVDNAFDDIFKSVEAEEEPDKESN